MFIKLHKASNGKEILVNVNNITVINCCNYNENQVVIDFIGIDGDGTVHSMYVKESFAEIEEIFKQ